MKRANRSQHGTQDLSGWGRPACWNLPTEVGVPPATPPDRGSRSADLQSAVSQVCNLRALRFGDALEYFDAKQLFHALRIKNPRYGRLQICATPDRGSPSRSIPEPRRASLTARHELTSRNCRSRRQEAL